MGRCRTTRLRGSLVLLGALLAAQQHGVGQTTSAIPPSPAAHWRAWQIFHRMLQGQAEQSRANLDALLRSRFGFTAQEIAVLLGAGESLSAALHTIDTDVRAEVERRYGRPTRGDPPPTVPRDRGRTDIVIEVEPGRTLRQVLAESGLIDQIERRRAATLASHIAHLRGRVAPARVDALDRWIAAEIAPGITELNRPPVGAPAAPRVPVDGGRVFRPPPR